MDIFPCGNALVVGQKNVKTYELIQILAAYFTTITRIEALDGLNRSFPRDHYSLIVVADPMDPGLSRNVLNDLREFFPQAKLIAIIDNLQQELEIRLRSIGVIFLGSHEQFKEDCDAIIGSACK